MPDRYNLYFNPNLSPGFMARVIADLDSLIEEDVDLNALAMDWERENTPEWTGDSEDESERPPIPLCYSISSPPRPIPFELTMLEEEVVRDWSESRKE